MTSIPVTTPPHRPTHNVRLSEEKVRAIVGLILPEHRFVSYEQLESGKSFNNRIYFIEVKPQSADVSPAHRHVPDRLVLKLSGHYFDARKVQNEVSVLSMLGKYCSALPTPRVIAWSEEGQRIQTADGRTLDTSKSQRDACSEHSWILMTRLPGRVLNTTDLEGEHGKQLLRTLAKTMLTWRSMLPDWQMIGNLRFQEPTELADAHASSKSTCRVEVIPPISFTVGGLILCQRYSPEALPTPLSYYRYLMSDQLSALRSYSVLQPLHTEIGTQVQQLVEDLARLSFFQSSTSETSDIKLTHMDFSPRNILVDRHSEDNALQVTGLIDWEFAAFLPADEEFLNMQVRQADDWTQEQYNCVTSHLAASGHEVPHSPGRAGEPVCSKYSTGSCRSCDSRRYAGLCVLVQVIDAIKPWFIQEGSHEGGELAREIESAARTVLDGIARLRDEFIT